ncbi:MAG: hypothetical protein V1921_06635 [Candidatus Altiarchaeota archaeon]
MTGTKIVKLKLEYEGQADGLPQIKGSVVDQVVGLYNKLKYPEEVVDDSQGLVERTSEFNLNSGELQMTLMKLENENKDGITFRVKTGLFLSALMRNSTETRFQLKPTRDMYYLGWRLSGGKKITVLGDLGNYAGLEMTDCEMHITGDAGSGTGAHMSNSRITVDGSTGDSTGAGMKSGTIKVGKKIQHIEPNIEGGEIWEAGKKVWPKEK